MDTFSIHEAEQGTIPILFAICTYSVLFKYVCLGASRAPRKLRFLLLNVHYLAGYLLFFTIPLLKLLFFYYYFSLPFLVDAFFFFFLFFYLPKRLILYYYSCILSSFIFGITFTRYIPRKERNNLTMCCILFFFTVNISFNSRRIIHHGFLD